LCRWPTESWGGFTDQLSALYWNSKFYQGVAYQGPNRGAYGDFRLCT
jgi:hypothetical protein